MIKILRIADGADGGAKAKTPSVADLQAENDALKSQLAQLTTEKAIQTADEKVIVAKMGQGLTRVQAVKVVERQKQYDASVTAQERAARKPGETPQARAERLQKLTAAAAKK
jgi:hypothetical protein